MMKQKQGLSPKLRPKGSNLLQTQGMLDKSNLTMEDRIFKMIMEIGTDEVKE